MIFGSGGIPPSPFAMARLKGATSPVNSGSYSILTQSLD